MSFTQEDIYVLSARQFQLYAGTIQAMLIIACAAITHDYLRYIILYTRYAILHHAVKSAEYQEDAKLTIFPE